MGISKKQIIATLDQLVGGVLAQTAASAAVILQIITVVGFIRTRTFPALVFWAGAFATLFFAVDTAQRKHVPTGRLRWVAADLLEVILMVVALDALGLLDAARRQAPDLLWLYIATFTIALLAILRRSQSGVMEWMKKLPRVHNGLDAVGMLACLACIGGIGLSLGAYGGDHAVVISILWLVLAWYLFLVAKRQPA